VLSENIVKLTHLQSLNLDQNQLTVLPSFISSLHHLTGLWINNNQLKSTPNEIGSLTSSFDWIVDQ
jgi:Leucine-rich repeat (LRR) protein